MNRTSFLSRIFLFPCMAMALTIFMARPGYSQDTTKTTGGKKIRIVAKVIEDKDGKKHEFDTTITINRRLKPGEKQEMMKSLEMRFKDLDDQMKELEIQLSEMRLPDSGMMDSVQRFTEKFFRDGSCKEIFRYRNQLRPHIFNYDFDFDIPELPDMPQQGFLEFHGEDEPGSFNKRVAPMIREEGQKLNDIMGDIPMDLVKSYSIRETKNGKKITIELKNEPVIEHRREVIILREPGHMKRHDRGMNPQMRKRIIIKSGEGEEKEKAEPGKL
jgi:hypothetical protein